MTPELEAKLDALIAAQTQMAESIGALAHSIAMLVTSMTDGEMEPMTQANSLDG